MPSRRSNRTAPLDAAPISDVSSDQVATTPEQSGLDALFTRIAAWEQDYRIAYGAWLFANHVVPLIRLARRYRVAMRSLLVVGSRLE